MDEAKYRPIPEYPDYRAGSDGSIWSYKTYTWKQLKPDRRKEDGRARYTITHKSGKLHRKYGAHFVLLAFVGPCPIGLECCHNNGDCLDDSEGNLRWDTSTNNKADMVIHGTQPRGEAHCSAKITDDEAEEIIEHYENGERQIDLAEVFDISPQAIHSIVHGKRKHAI